MILRPLVWIQWEGQTYRFPTLSLRKPSPSVACACCADRVEWLCGQVSTTGMVKTNAPRSRSPSAYGCWPRRSGTSLTQLQNLGGGTVTDYLRTLSVCLITRWSRRPRALVVRERVWLVSHMGNLDEKQRCLDALLEARGAKFQGNSLLSSASYCGKIVA